MFRRFLIPFLAAALSLLPLSPVPALAQGAGPNPSGQACQWNYDIENGISTATYCGNVKYAATGVCADATSVGLVGDGVTPNDAAFNAWYKAGKENCLKFGFGKFMFASQISKTLASNAQTLTATGGTYNSATGLVTLTTSTAPTFPVGSIINITALTGSGSLINISGLFYAKTIAGNTVTYAAPPGYGTMTISSGVVFGANHQTISLLGSGSSGTKLYFPNANGGIQIISGGTTSPNTAFGNSFHIRDMTISTAQHSGGNALDFEGFSFPFGVPPTSDVTNVELQGDDYIAPNNGTAYWTRGFLVNCWSNVDITNVGSYGNPSTPSGVGGNITCVSGNGGFAVTINLQTVNFYFQQIGLLLGSSWQGVTVNQSNFNGGALAGGSKGITLDTGTTGVLAGLTITNSQFGGIDFPINLNATSNAVDDVTIANNTIFVSNTNDIGVEDNFPGGAAPLVNITNNGFFGNNSVGTNAIIVGASVGTISGNFGQNVAQGIVVLAGSSKLAITENGIYSQAGLVNGGCSTCIIANNPSINPIGVTQATYATASGATYTAGSSPETHYFTGGAVTAVHLTNSAGALACSTTPCTVDLGPNEGMALIYTTAPTDSKSIH